MSDEDRKQRTDILIPIWNKFKAIISEGRDIDIQTIQNFADRTCCIPGAVVFNGNVYTLVVQLYTRRCAQKQKPLHNKTLQQNPRTQPPCLQISDRLQ